MLLEPVHRKWEPIDDGVLPLALAAMRTAWVWFLIHIWSRWAQPQRGDLLALPVVFGLLACSTLVSQLGSHAVRSMRRATTLVTLGGLAGIAVALYAEFGLGRAAAWDATWLRAALRAPAASIFILVIAVWLWWWGILAGRDRLYHDTYANNFTLGAMMVAAALATSYATGIIPPGQALVALLAFFALGLGTLALAGLQSTRAMELRRTQQSLAISRYWLGTVAGVIAIVLALGLLLAQLFVPGAIDHVLAIIGTILNLIERVLIFLAMIVAYLFFGFFDLLGKAGLRLPQGVEVPTIQVPNIADQFKDVNQQPAGLSPALTLGLRISAGVILLLVIVAIFALAYRRFLALREEDVETTREMILSMDLLKEQLGRLFGRKRLAAETQIPPFAPVIGDDPRARIRQTYQELLAWGAANGHPRRPGFTPLEYAAWLKEMTDGQHEAVTLITRAYLAARYGSGAISEATADEAARAWQAMSNGNSSGS